MGAGPVGLTAAIELTRRGCPIRIIEKRASQSVRSKAIGINPRTLELLEPSAVTPRLLDAGVQLDQFRFGTEDQQYFSIQFDCLAHRYPFMIGLPQSETEAVLEKRLNELGCFVERSVELIGLKQHTNGIELQLRRDDTDTEDITVAHVIGADGAHSDVRNQLGIPFPGTTLPGDWSLADVKLETDLDPSAAHVVLRDERIVFMISFRKGIWRVASDRTNVLSKLPSGTTIHEVLWQSNFKVSFRQAKRYAERNVFLCGDAAHVHSPLGARGMNMGIEDAAELAWRWEKSQLDQYGASRHRATAAAIRMVKAQTWLATNRGLSAHLIRSQVIPLITRFAPVRTQMVQRMAGFSYSEYRVPD